MLNYQVTKFVKNFGKKKKRKKKRMENLMI